MPDYRTPQIPKPIEPESLIPGGIKPTDHWHIKTNDNTCSRCRKEVPEEDAPLLIWRGEENMDMLMYCEGCLTRHA